MTDHRQITLRRGGEALDVDEGLADLLPTLWAAAVNTAYSCQGNPGGDMDDPANLAYVAFTSAKDTARFAARVPADRPGWLWCVEHKTVGARDSVHFPPVDLPWLLARFPVVGMRDSA